MTTATKPSPEITRAAERYLEQYGDPLVMNTYLKVTILVLAVVCLALAGLVFKSQKALANMHPLIVRINDVGRAEAIDYRNFQYRPQEAENKYYLTRWAELYFSRNRFTIERDQTNALYFLNSDVQRAVIDQERKDNIIPTYIKDSTLPYVDVEVKKVVLDDLRQSPYSARIEFEKVFTNPADHTELKRERWTASVTYVFRENVKNNELAVNPLGLTIVRFRADQAFELRDVSTFPEAYPCPYLLPIRLLHPPCLCARWSGDSERRRRGNCGGELRRLLRVGIAARVAAAIAADFRSQSTDENFGPVCVCRYVSRLLPGHCFGAYPAPGGTAPLCFGYAALRVTVPPYGHPPEIASLALGSRAPRLASPGVTRARSGNSTNGDTPCIRTK